MECVSGSSKNNFMGFKFTHRTPSFSDDFSAVNALSGDDFFIDDLLNFPTDAGFVEENNNPQADDTENHKTLHVFPANDDKTTIQETELCFPVNDVDDLEWVSHFVDDSFSGDYSVTYPAVNFPETQTETETETVTLVSVNPTFRNSFHKRARSKRNRTGGSVWSLRSSSRLTDSSTSSSYTSSCTSKPILGELPVQMLKRKRPVQMGGSAGAGQSQTRRCSHCLVQKTPQWRAGPLGVKTLCNACGVRFKSGRLLPEYRPACSPTFSSEVHSNDHRKVLEMRRKKAEAACGGLTLPV